MTQRPHEIDELLTHFETMNTPLDNSVVETAATMLTKDCETQIQTIQSEVIRLQTENLKLTNDRFALHRALHIIAHKIKCAPRKRPMTRPETEFNECVELAKRTLKKIS